MSERSLRVAFIGTAGVPNRYGGFEAFLEHCGPEIAKACDEVIVTCDAALYAERSPRFAGMRRLFLPVRANGAPSVLHDLLAFLAVFPRASHIVVLGVSGGLWFPLFRAACGLSGRRLLVNVDGVESRRAKYGAGRQRLLRAFDALAQRFAHGVVYDNAALAPWLAPVARRKAVEIAYSGDHVLRTGAPRVPGTALTICRIEPENNVEMLLEGARRSPLARYTVVGNWEHSAYGRALRARYTGDPRLVLRDPVYEPAALAALREQCAHYLHGHSVGGTNPSLVEMLFYESDLLCFDVPFHRATAGACARYFRTADELAALLAAPAPVDAVARGTQRARYTRARIAAGYLAALRGDEAPTPAPARAARLRER